MALGGTRLFVALDARAAVAAAVGGGLRGARLRGFARVPLEPGALVPSPSGASLARLSATHQWYRSRRGWGGVYHPALSA